MIYVNDYHCGTDSETIELPTSCTTTGPDENDIIIRNVIGCSYLCWVLRLLPANTRIYNVVIDGILDTCDPNDRPVGTILLGDGGYGANQPESMSGITISNIVCNSSTGITLAGYMKDSTITNVVNRNPATCAFVVSREDECIPDRDRGCCEIIRLPKQYVSNAIKRHQ